jgi:hypothetical protein
VAIIPRKANRVVANSLHTFKLQVGANGGGVEDSFPGPFVPARGARALTPKVAVGESPGLAVAPRQLQDLISLVGPDIRRGVAHFRISQGIARIVGPLPMSVANETGCGTGGGDGTVFREGGER